MKTRLYFSLFLLIGIVVEWLATGAESVGQEAAIAVIKESEEITENLKMPMMTVIRQNPDVSRWNGLFEKHVFSIVALPIKNDPRSIRTRPARVSQAGMLAAHEIMVSKALIDYYAKHHLHDVMILRKTIGSIQLEKKNGSNTLFESHFVVEKDDCIVAVRIAERDKIISHLEKPNSIESIRANYVKIMQDRAVDLTQRKQWKEALEYWEQLRELESLSPKLYTESALCYLELNQSDNALALLKEGINRYEKTSDSSFFETMGDLLLRIKTPEAEEIAKQAYEKAMELFQESQPVNESIFP